MKKRTLILIAIAAGVWAFVFIFYLWPVFFGKEKPAKLARSSRPASSVALKLPALELGEATPVKLNLNLAPFKLKERQEFTKLLLESSKSSEGFPYRYVGYTYTEMGMKIFFESEGRIVEVGIGERFGSYMVMYASELGLLVLDTSQQRIMVVR
ncbi:MAG: hypothetical protein J7J80_05330 [Thermotogae bacterium]|nr:hypothetical protein [Thermotogota bacterium]